MFGEKNSLKVASSSQELNPWGHEPLKMIREWNDLPANVVEIGNLRSFKIALKSYMGIS